MISRSLIFTVVVLGLSGCQTSAKKNNSPATGSNRAPAAESLTLPFTLAAPFNSEQKFKLPVIDELHAPQKVTKRTPAIVVKPNDIAIPKAKQVSTLIFDIPVAYNSKVKNWIEYFQTQGRPWFTKWLERSTRYMPAIQKILQQHGLPQDLAYMAMIESGFSANAYSVAKAAGPWQFIQATGTRFGLRTSWWLDERRDFEKSTIAASKYLRSLYGMFKSWYLVAAAYNTGENRVKRMIAKHGTKNYWKLSQKQALLDETKEYVPKMIAAMLISKSPALYGFRKINFQETLEFEHFRAPGGVNLNSLATSLGVSGNYLRELNPELVKGVVPDHVEGHLIRIPKGTAGLMSRYIRKNYLSQN